MGIKLKVSDFLLKKFGRLTIICDAGIVIKNYGNEKKYYQRVRCCCECGSEKNYDLISVKNGHTKSCGCFIKLDTSKRFLKHGMSFSPEYRTWTAVKGRCTNQKNTQYIDYGGRGITICDRWLNSFENFYTDMGKKPTPQHSIERINNDLGYYKENCKWATQKEQARNTRQNVYVVYLGEKMCLTDLAIKTGISVYTIRHRFYKMNMSIDDIVSTPILQRNRKNKLSICD